MRIALTCIFAVSLFSCKITTDEPDTFTVAFNANGGSGSIESITKTENEEFELPANTFTRTGYTFASWNTKQAPDESSKSYKDKEKITLTEDLTLYAQWAAGTGTAYKVEHWQQNITDDNYTLAKTEPMTGTTGEETVAKAEETAGFTAKKFTQEKIAPDGSTVVKIRYDRKIITLTFDADNGEEKTTLSGKFGAEIVSPSPEKTDFIFTGWNTDKIPTESSKSYKDKIILTEDLTLYAQWEEILYKINYELNGGTNASENPSTFKKSDNIALTEPTYEYFDFCGWYLTQDFTDENITGWNVGEKTDDVTVYAKWTVKAENVVNAINKLTEGTHNIFVVGEIDKTTVKNIGNTLCSNQNSSNKNAKVNLDLSGTTGLENIPSRVFYGCTSLTNIELPESITSIGDYAFYGCESLTNIRLPESITSISDNTFYGCESLTNIKLPESVTSIGGYAFGKCTSLTDIEIPANVTAIDGSAFVACHNVTSLHVENNNKYYQSFNNCIYTKDGQTLICVLGNPSSISFLQSITSIGNHSFKYCLSLKDIEIPASITNIGNWAFDNCISLTNIEIPESVTSIGRGTFYCCIKLVNIAIPKSITNIDASAFEYCRSLTNIEIPESVTSIGHSAFWSCTSLTDIEIPTSVTTIEDYAFYACSSLTTVNYMGTKEQWNSISVDGSGNKNLTSAKIICTDGIINE